MKRYLNNIVFLEEKDCIVFKTMDSRDIFVAICSDGNNKYIKFENDDILSVTANLLLKKEFREAKDLVFNNVTFTNNMYIVHKQKNSNLYGVTKIEIVKNKIKQANIVSDDKELLNKLLNGIKTLSEKSTYNSNDK